MEQESTKIVSILSNDTSTKADNDLLKKYQVNKKINIKRRIMTVIFPLFISVMLLLIYLFIPGNGFLKDGVINEVGNIQEGISEEIIRFHVLANSDKEEDQALKIKVKDAIVAGLKEPLQGTNNKEEAREVLQDNVPLIINIAKNIIEEEGYDYNVSANIVDSYFPTKIYGDMTFPPGIYEALRVEIGDGKGKNWWCVMYPPLCFVEGTYSVVPEESKDQLKYILTEEEYEALAKEGKLKVKAKFKLKEVLEEWLSK